MAKSLCRIMPPEAEKTGVKPDWGQVAVSRACIFISIFLFQLSVTAYGQVSLLDKPVTFARQHTTLYEALNLISGKTGCLFIYDSRVVESDRRVKLEADNIPLRQLLNRLLNNPELDYKVIGEHILIYRSEKPPQITSRPVPVVPAADSSRQIIIKGMVYDHDGNKPVPYASIGILEENLGTITNADGYFVLKIPARYAGSSLVVSHLGYMSRKIPIGLLNEQKVDIFLERRVISLQEVIIRYIDPLTIISKAMELRSVNNAVEPAYVTAFYREGVQKNNRYISYSEAVFKVYKSSYRQNENADQVKLLKSRKVQNAGLKDTVMLKLKAGVLSALQLDIVKSVPGFLDLSDNPEYTYTYSDLVSYNDRNAYAIGFIRKEGNEGSLYTGTLYVDNESFAILGADFEINPDCLDKAVDNLVLRKSRKLNVKLEKISYSVTYAPFNGRYYLNHARCDLRIRTHLRNHITSDNFSTFLEIAVCHIDTLNVVRFEKEEVLKPNVVFSDEPYVYDEFFWGDYNIIVPEEKLNEALSRISSKIEKIE